MTQVKKTSKKAKKAPAIDLRCEFLKLNVKEQAQVTHFFNLHNAAHFMYDGLSDQAKAYVNYCIQLSREADKIEAKQEK